MQKMILFAFVMLALGFAHCEYVEKNFYKLPVSVMKESALSLYSMNMQTVGSGEISVARIVYIPPFRRQPMWSIWYRKLDANDLSLISTTSFGYTAGSVYALFYSGYVIDFQYYSGPMGLDPRQMSITQFNFEQNKTLPSISIGEDAMYSTSVIEGDNVYIIYTKGQQMYVTRFKVGETSLKETVAVPIQTGIATPQMAVVSSGQVLVSLQVDDNYSEILVDLKQGNFKVNRLGGFYRSLACSSYVTNKYYGTVCYDANPYVGIVNFFVTRNSSQKLETLYTLDPSQEKLLGTYTNGDYLVTITQNLEEEGKPMSYELWDLETMSSVTGKVVFVVGSKDNTESVLYQGPNGNLYFVRYTHVTYQSQDLNEVSVGILLENTASTDVTDEKLIKYFLA